MARGYAWGLSSSRADLVLQRQLPDSLPGRREDRVGDSRGGDRRPRLADPSGLLAVAHQIDFDRRRLVYPKHANVVKVRLLHPAVLERDLAIEGAADSEDDSALDLRFHGLRVPHAAAVDCADDAVHAPLAGLRHLDLRDLRQVAVPTAVEERNAAGAAGRQRLAPTRRLRREGA